VYCVSQNTDGGTQCDALITAGLGGRLFFPQDASYNASLTSYYSGNVQHLHPWCILQPETTEQVSTAVKALASQSPADNWAVAVRGGGHAFWPSNNVDHGVTIDLSLMNQTAFKNCSGGSIVSVGPGARWGPVFEYLQQYDMSTTGGREGHVGVSGYLLGGGMIPNF
jgi:FAD/FMN-containing dehydrogenase